VSTAKHGEKVEHGRAYVAPGGSHLVLNNGSIRLQKGPRENRHLPSVDALFRSAARAHRDRVIAVVLSGALDDGAAGALSVKARGGVVIVQDPKDARIPDMPRNVLRYVKADYCLPSEEIAGRIAKLVRAKIKPVARNGKRGRGTKPNGEHREQPAPIVCPDCGGPLTEKREGHLLQFECQVGHKFSPQAVSEEHANALERALWVALRHLSERRAIQQTLAAQYHEDPVMVQRYEENAEAASHDMALLREILERL
jgi:two-component system, chemotaxis family, protein-glutamate methylesterase/glutaminase